jgi:hypothetical protein
MRGLSYHYPKGGFVPVGEMQIEFVARGVLLEIGVGFQRLIAQSSQLQWVSGLRIVKFDEEQFQSWLHYQAVFHNLARYQSNSVTCRTASLQFPSAQMVVLASL